MVRGTIPPEDGAWTPDRSHEGRHEHEAACRNRCTRAADPVLRDGWTGQRLHRSESAVEQSSERRLALGPLSGSCCARPCRATDRGYDADWFREALIDRKITPCIPGRKSREKPIKYDKRRYRKRNRIEIMFGRLKDWRRVATRYDRSPTVFLSAIALAATVIFWL